MINTKKTGATSFKHLIAALTKHTMLAVAAFITAGFFMLIFLDNIFMPVLLKSGTETNTPDLTGKSLVEAEKIVSDHGLRLLAVSTEYNVQYPENTISFQYPQPNAQVKPGRRIQVRISLGPRPVEMPAVVGKSRRDAELMLKPYGLAVERFEWVHSNNYVRGIVAGQDPEGNRKIPENAHIVLYISDGQPEMNAVMPRVIDLGLSSALDTLRAYNFNMEKVKTHLERAPQLLPETIIDQHPDPGVLTYTETDIDLIISSQ